MKLAAAIALLFAAAAGAELCDLPSRSLRGIERKSWNAGNERLVICEMDRGVFVIHTGRRGRGLIFQSEDTEWDYEPAPPNFTFTVYTWRSHAEPRVPLLRFDVRLTSTGARYKTLFALRGKPFSEARFQEYLREFRDPATSEMRQQELLYTMREEGVSKAGRALQLLRALDAKGFVAKELGGVIADLELARTYPHAR